MLGFRHSANRNGPARATSLGSRRFGSPFFNCADDGLDRQPLPAFHRVLAPHARLYSEMVHRRGDPRRPRELLAFDPSEHPVALQLGGSEPGRWRRRRGIGEPASTRSTSMRLSVGPGAGGRFGACLMREPGLVADRGRR